MGYTESYIKKHIAENPNNGERANMNEKTLIFKLEEYETTYTYDKMNIINKMIEYNKKENILDIRGSGIYNFNVGESTIQLDLSINEDIISIKPYIIYREEHIHDDLLKIMKLDNDLYNILKENNLQKK